MMIFGHIGPFQDHGGALLIHTLEGYYTSHKSNWALEVIETHVKFVESLKSS